MNKSHVIDRAGAARTAIHARFMTLIEANTWLWAVLSARVREFLEAPCRGPPKAAVHQTGEGYRAESAANASI